MQNIEIKAKYENLKQAEKIAEKLGAKFLEDLHQIDTYFAVRKGRLKLREISSRQTQLIFYERADQSGPKTSDYEIYPVENKDELKSILSKALGVTQIVEKERKVYLYEHVRIHLDQVKKLGNFLEFEGLLFETSEKKAITGKVEKLLSTFRISPNDLVQGSYSDLIILLNGKRHT